MSRPSPPVPRVHVTADEAGLRVTSTEDLVVPAYGLDGSAAPATLNGKGLVGEPLDLANVLSAARCSGETIIYTPEASRALRVASQSIRFRRVPGRPGLVRATAGWRASRAAIPNRKLPGRKAGPPGSALWPSTLHELPSVAVTVSADAAVELATATRALGGAVDVDPWVAEVIAAAGAEPQYPLEGLRKYQAVAVARHLASRNGFANLCGTGLGKTVMVLAAWAARSGGRRNWSALVTTRVALRAQWATEVARWTPGFELLVADTGSSLAGALDAVAAGVGPSIIVCSHDLAVRHADKLAAFRWDEVCIDEAVILKPGSRKAKAMWELRQSARFGVALSGTPLESTPALLAAVVNWCANRPDMVDLGDLVGDEALLACGPSVFRRTRLEVADELPTVDLVVVPVTATKAESAAAKRAAMIVADLHERARGTGSAALVARAAAARVELVAAAKATQVACSSLDALAELSGSAAVDIAAAAGPGPEIPSKLGYLLDECQQAISEGDRVVVFSDSPAVCQQVTRVFTDAGLRAAAAVSGSAREKALAAWASGEVDVLVLGKAASEGLNLQAAALVLFADTPTEVASWVQRIGRAARLGAVTGEVRVRVPVLDGTVEQEAAQALLPAVQTALAGGAVEFPGGPQVFAGRVTRTRRAS